MTTMRDAGQLSIQDCLRRARKAWFAAGVRRGDRAVLSAELSHELAVAGDVRDVLGDDPAAAARDWAHERKLTDRRLRLSVVLPATIVPGVLAAGAVLATLYQAFTANGHTVLNRAGGPTVLGVYVASGALSFVAMLVGASVALQLVGDSTRRRTVRVFALALPVAAVLAAGAGVGTAAARDFGTDRSDVELVVAAVLGALVITLTAARSFAVHRHQER